LVISTFVGKDETKGLGTTDDETTDDETTGAGTGAAAAKAQTAA
jgi:hypothetical protein